MMLLLQMPVNRGALRAFWLLLSFAMGLISLVVLALFGVADLGARIVTAVGVAALIATPGLVRPDLAWLPYRAWNWSARQFGMHAVRYVTAVCFFVVMPILRRTTGPRRFITASDEASMWLARGTQPSGMYASQYHDTGVDLSDGSWIRPLRAWVRASGHRAALALVPFLVLVKVLHPEQAKVQPVSRNIYTLY